MPTNDAQLTQLLEPVVTGAGLVLEDVAVSTVGRRRLVRVVVDLTDDETGSVDLDRVAAVSREVGDALDGSDVLGEAPYALEVTTPGVDRPLSRRRHWLRARTRLVRVERDGQEPLTGRLVEVAEQGPVLDVAGERVTVPFGQVRHGVVEVEFTKPAKPRPAAWGPAPDDETDETDSDETYEDL